MTIEKIYMRDLKPKDIVLRENGTWYVVSDIKLLINEGGKIIVKNGLDNKKNIVLFGWEAKCSKIKNW